MADYSNCGIDCDACKFKAEMNCKGCKANKGKIFWGECDIFKCSNNDKKISHCGKCGNFPCDMLKEFAEKENPERIENLKNLNKQEEF